MLFLIFSTKFGFFWKNPITLDVIGDHSQVLHCKIEIFNNQCFASFIYAASSFYNRKVLWESLIDFHSLCNLPWLVGGDFNAITCTSERMGGSNPSHRSMNDFNNIILSCNLIDIGFVGDKFTWNRGHLWQRLDCVLFNDAWINFFNSTNVQHLARILSDHSPLLININLRQYNAPSQFRFQNMCLLNNSFLNVSQNNWNAPLHPDNDIKGMVRLWFKLKRLKYVLKWWNRHVFRNIFSNIIHVEHLINSTEILYSNDPSVANLELLNKYKVELNNFQNQEEIFWKQKVAAKHLVEGDRNTKFFHALVKRKCVKNTINKVQKEDGSFTDNNMEIKNLAIGHFQNLFNNNFSSNLVMNFSFITSLISIEDNLFLSSTPTLEEVKKTIMDMNCDFVAGPDGFTTLFFQKTWNIISFDIYNAVIDFFGGSPMPKIFSSTSLVLIPKNNSTKTWNVFCLISLCTCFNKLISKLISDRLSVVLPNIISHPQMGFVKGRAITDNILLAHELVHDLDVRVRGGGGGI
ncbi:hypothetical protein MA16_Dca020712 [Dendrobium catenatum]|uniref:Uncharacterized protein n=1 Tax=Dendrobium catenatum TaxID=906689 RepID=A0A2I0WGZ7_9ASPA|nr:hypothetical protein MA16_Dca020712 [Dendrobium catenatum]